MLLCIGITLVLFLLTWAVPGDAAIAALGEAGMDDPRAVQAFRDRYGLDDPLPVQYGRYVANLVQGDLGVSMVSRRPVASELARFVPATLELAVVALVLATVVGVGLGVIAAANGGGRLDGFIRVVSLAGVSVPSFWLALLAFYILFFQLGWLPGIGRLHPTALPPPQITGAYSIDAALAGDWPLMRDAVHHLILPAMVLAANPIGMLTRFTRSAVLEVLNEDYVRMARSKGLPGRIVITRHVLRAALVPVITLLGVVFGSVLSGTVLVEMIFSWPGVGRYAFQSAAALDVQAIMGVSVFVALVYVVMSFLVDVLYGIIDPRIRTT